MAFDTHGQKAFSRVLQDVLATYNIDKKRFLKYLINIEMQAEDHQVILGSVVKLQFFENQVIYKGTPHNLTDLQLQTLKKMATAAPSMVDNVSFSADKQTLQTTISVLRNMLADNDKSLICTENKTDKPNSEAIGYRLNLQVTEISGLDVVKA